jgi:hypothetical protein
MKHEHLTCSARSQTSASMLMNIGDKSGTINAHSIEKDGLFHDHPSQ